MLKFAFYSVLYPRVYYSILYHQLNESIEKHFIIYERVLYVQSVFDNARTNQKLNFMEPYTPFRVFTDFSKKSRCILSLFKCQRSLLSRCTARIYFDINSTVNQYNT